MWDHPAITSEGVKLHATHNKKQKNSATYDKKVDPTTSCSLDDRDMFLKRLTKNLHIFITISHLNALHKFVNETFTFCTMLSLPLNWFRAVSYNVLRQTLQAKTIKCSGIAQE